MSIPQNPNAGAFFETNILQKGWDCDMIENVPCLAAKRSFYGTLFD
jgi:hypothetical protein